MLSHASRPVRERHFFKDLPTRGELEALARRLPGGVRDLLSTRSARLKELGLRPEMLDDEALYDLLTREPRLLRRPIVTDGARVIVGLDRAAIAALAETDADPDPAANQRR